MRTYLDAPISVWWDITRRCNLHCKHCYSSSSATDDVTELSTEEAKSLVDQLAQAGVFYVYFLGGEPFVRADILTVLEHTRARGLQVMVNTSGWFIDGSTAQQLAALGVKNVRVSLDGAKPSTHDAFRGKSGSFERAIESIRLLKRAGIAWVSISTTLSRENMHETGDLIELAVREGARDIQLIAISGTGRALAFPDLALTSSDADVLRPVLETKRKEHANKLIVYGAEGLMTKSCSRCVSNGVEPDFMGCRAGRTVCNIDANGDVIPCLLLREPVAGNVRLSPFGEIWRNSVVFKEMRQVCTSHHECIDCEWNAVCARECPLSSSQLEVTAGTRSEHLMTVAGEHRDRRYCLSFGVNCCQ